jgi:hypothetical protein
MKPPAQCPSKVSQIIEDRYIDEDKLLDICKQRFGLGNYRLRVRVILSSYTALKLLQLMFHSSSSTNGTSRLPQNSMRYEQPSCSLSLVVWPLTQSTSMRWYSARFSSKQRDSRTKTKADEEQTSTLNPQLLPYSIPISIHRHALLVSNQRLLWRTPYHIIS